MSLADAALTGAALGAAGFAGLAAFGLYRIATPTTGSRIRLRWPPRAALLVIDVQEDFLAAEGGHTYPRGESDAVVAVIRNVIAVARAKEVPVIYIRQEFSEFATRLVARLVFRGLGCKGRPGTRLDPRLPPNPDNTFTKPVGDAFSNPELDRYLASLNVGELFLVGLDGVGSVHRTARGAGNRGYKVNFISDAVATGFPAKWRSLLAGHVAGGAAALSSAELEGRLVERAPAAGHVGTAASPPRRAVAAAAEER